MTENLPTFKPLGRLVPTVRKLVMALNALGSNLYEIETKTVSTAPSMGYKVVNVNPSEPK